MDDKHIWSIIHQPVPPIIVSAASHESTCESCPPSAWRIGPWHSLRSHGGKGIGNFGGLAYQIPHKSNQTNDHHRIPKDNFCWQVSLPPWWEWTLQFQHQQSKGSRSATIGCIGHSTPLQSSQPHHFCAIPEGPQTWTNKIARWYFQGNLLHWR